MLTSVSFISSPRRALRMLSLLLFGIASFFPALTAQEPFQLDPGSLTFTVPAGDPAASASQTVRIVNTLSDSYTWQILSIGSNIEVSAESGTLPGNGSASFTVRLKSDSLIGPESYPNLYSLSIPIMSGTVTVRNLRLNIGVKGTPSAQLTLDPLSFTFNPLTSEFYYSKYETLKVKNSGYGTYGAWATMDISFTQAQTDTRWGIRRLMPNGDYYAKFDYQVSRKPSNQTERVPFYIFANHLPVGAYKGTITVTSAEATNSPRSVTLTLNVTEKPAQTVRDVRLWQMIPLVPTSGAFSDTKGNNIATFGGVRAPVLSATKDSLRVLVPAGLLRDRDKTILTDTIPRLVDVVVRVVRSAGDTVEVVRTQVRFIPPPLLRFDEVSGTAPPLRQDTIRGAGSAFIRTYAFIGNRNDGYASVRLTNTSLATPPLDLLLRVLSPPPFNRLFDGDPDTLLLTRGNPNLLNIGIMNAGVQFPIDQDGIYLVAVGAGAPGDPVVPGTSWGPFPSLYQLHLTANVGLPLPQDYPRGVRLTTLINPPAPQQEILGNAAAGTVVAGEFAQSGLFKFGNPVSTSPFAVAVLIPDTAGGFRFGRPPVRAPAPVRLVDPSVPTAQTPGVSTPVPGTVIDFTQVPIPPTPLIPGFPPGPASIIGANNGDVATIPSGSSLIADMGSGNDIVDGAGADFRIYAEGAYAVAVSNTPFANTFVEAGTGAGQKEFDLAGTGLFAVRYVRITAASGSVNVDAVQSLHFFVDQIHETAGPLARAPSATITMRRQKSPVTPLDPFLELIGVDGSSLGKNDSGFGDDVDQALTDAALIKASLPQSGFYRFMGRGYDTQPDNTHRGTFFARLETGGTYDQVEIPISDKNEEQTNAQKEGLITDTRQRNSYLLRVSPGMNVNIVVNGKGSSALADPLIEVYDPEDFLIAANDNYSTGRGRNAALNITLATAGRTFPDPSTYRIVVMGIDTSTAAPSPLPEGIAHLRTANGGRYDVKVFTGPMTGETPKAPMIFGITPDAAAQNAANVDVTINGSNFVGGAAVTVSGSGVTVKTATVENASRIHAIVDIAADAAPGKRDIIVTNPGGLAGSATGVLQIMKKIGNVQLTWSAPPQGQTMEPPGNLNATFTRSLGIDPPGRPANIAHHRKAMASAVAAQRRTASMMKPAGMQSPIMEMEPNNTPAQAQVLTGDTLIELTGHAEIRDAGTIFDGDDDIEDLFEVSTQAEGLFIMLTGFTSDCDLFLIEPSDTTILDLSTNISSEGEEYIEWTDLPSGTYLVGVSIFDEDPLGPDSSGYVLQLAGNFGKAAALTLQSYSIHRSVKANAKSTGAKIGSVGAGTTSFTDAVPHTGNFFYQVTAVYNQGESTPSNEVSRMVTEVASDASDRAIPSAYALLQNYPNPFNPTTRIVYQLPREGRITLSVFDVLGREVALLVDDVKQPGSYSVMWDASRQSSGMYFYRLRSGSYSETRKLLLVR